MEDIGEDELLMLLLMMEAELDKVQQLGRELLGEKSLHGIIDVLAISQDVAH
jgi:hypothetical protein